MKKLLFVLVLVGMSPLQAAPVYYEIDPSHTYPHFAINHLGFSTLYGRFDHTRGRVMMDRENDNGFISATIDAVSITTGFSKRDDHLRSPDFLNVTEFPKIKYESTNIDFLSADKARVQGKLTMLGVTRDVDLDVFSIHCGVNPINKKETCGFEANAQIKRSDFGSRYGAPQIGDEMKLWFQVEAIREN